jgi:hypothetical protein
VLGEGDGALPQCGPVRVVVGTPQRRVHVHNDVLVLLPASGFGVHWFRGAGVLGCRGVRV